MVSRVIAISLALASVQAIAQDNTPMTEEEKPWFMKEEWLRQNAPYGIDVTPDTKAWIIVNLGIGGDVYSILADDYEVRDQRWPKAWLRGYHKANAKVPYRESRTLLHFDCADNTYYQTYEQTYKADRTIYSVQSRRTYPTPIVPGSLAEDWKAMMCRPR